MVGDALLKETIFIPSPCFRSVSPPLAFFHICPGFWKHAFETLGLSDVTMHCNCCQQWVRVSKGSKPSHPDCSPKWAEGEEGLGVQ